MAVYEFPALGFDPVAGDPPAVEDVQREVGAHGERLAEAAQRLSRLASQGPAKLPQGAHLLHESGLDHE